MIASSVTTVWSLTMTSWPPPSAVVNPISAHGLENPLRKHFSIGSDDSNGNERRIVTPATASSGGAPVVTAPQCMDCVERKLRVQSMDARCYPEIGST